MSPVPDAPDPFQLDLLCAIKRIEQIGAEVESRDNGELTGLAELLIHRLLTCDVPALRAYLTPATLAWEVAIANIVDPARRHLVAPPEPPPAAPVGFGPELGG